MFLVKAIDLALEQHSELLRDTNKTTTTTKNDDEKGGRTEANENHAAGDDASDSESGVSAADIWFGDAEEKLLSPMLDFYRSKYPDTRVSTLEILLDVLQSHGHSLKGRG
mmetsp:Transcript_4873/g.8869  ORF Transcript_4873/g.8869 Transcript_4873/m.8869 type:complete len:110 (-) Transcript_4873:338-667(-)